jgi:hypothetical protein
VSDVIAALESADLPDAINVKATGKAKNPFG